MNETTETHLTLLKFNKVKDMIMLVPTEQEVYNKIKGASRFEYFSASGPGLIRLLHPFIKEQLYSKRADVFIMRISLLLPWSPPISEMTRKETNVSNPTRRASISDEVISNFLEFLELANYLEGCASKYIFTFECYDCFPFFKYAFAENDSDKVMCLKNYMTFTKGISTPGRENSKDFDIGQQHYDDAQRVIQEFGFKIAEMTNVYGKIETSIHLHLLKDMDPARYYRIESRRVSAYDLQYPQTSIENVDTTEYHNDDPSIDKALLLKIVAKRFSDDELRTLCFSLNFQYDDLAGEGITGKMRELISFFEHRKQISKLINSISQLRPDIDLRTIYSTMT